MNYSKVRPNTCFMFFLWKIKNPTERLETHAKVNRTAEIVQDFTVTCFLAFRSLVSLPVYWTELSRVAKKFCSTVFSATLPGCSCCMSNTKNIRLKRLKLMIQLSLSAYLVSFLPIRTLASFRSRVSSPSLFIFN